LRGSTRRKRRKKIRFQGHRNKKRIPRRGSKANGNQKRKRKNSRKKTRSRKHEKKYRTQQWRKNAT
jgi:hypothetical protein